MPRIRGGPKPLDMTGRRFGRLVVVSLSAKRTGKPGAYWDCRCDCGATKAVHGSHLREGTTSSCGCGMRASVRLRNVKRAEARKGEAGTLLCRRCGLYRLPDAFSPRNTWCKRCHADHATVYAKAHRAERTEYQRIRRNRNPEVRAKKRAVDRAGYVRHRDERLQYQVAYQHTGQGKRVHAGANARYRMTDNGRRSHALSQEKRRVAKRGGMPDPISVQIANELLTAFKGLCAWCGVSPATCFDHVYALSKGGRHTVGNLVPSCDPCNSRKSNKPPEEWAARLGVDLSVVLRRAGLGDVEAAGGQ